MPLFFFTLLLFIIPNSILFLNNGNYLNSVVWSILLSTLLLVSIRPKHYYFLLGFIWFLPVACFYMYGYSRPLDTFLFSVIFDTNLEESESFFGSKFYPYVGIYLLFIIGTSYIYLSKRIPKTDFFPIKRKYIVAPFILVGLAYISYNYLTSRTLMGVYEKGKDTIQVGIIDSYPVSLLYNGNLFKEEMFKIKDRKDQLKNFTFNSVQRDNGPDVVVLVLGETSRRDRWGLNGYSRETTPLLSKKENLYNYTNALSLASATLLSVPMTLTRKNEAKVLSVDYNESSIIKAFKEVGYSTYWLSTQQKIGIFDSLTSYYASEADNVSFFNFSNGSEDRDLDEVLINKLKDVLKKDNGKKFIVLHTMGSHQLYNKRYPASFDKFKPSTNDLKFYDPSNRKYKTEINNAYDNSILYTDYILSQIIDSVNDANKKSVVLYTSDHGEDLFDGDCNKTSHGGTSIYNFQVPLFVWVSNQYAVKYPSKVKVISGNTKKPINHTSIFPTLLSMSNISVKNFDDSRSLTNEKIKYDRFVFGNINFDSVKPKGVCKLLS
ncbi:TPA: phosphoethanolamine transferase [Acinetobacter baumannii]